ncbi:M20 family metallopeptidase [Acidovorax lacteus]|uniref:M20 family metallopeptidase n=1 Tax=Acidovorax lacteus TaxID=1924988 RepID=A0ABP8L3T8_9BURK
MTNTHRNTAIARAVAYLEEGGFAADLARRVALRTESDTGAPGPALDAYLVDEMTPWLGTLGFDCGIHPNPDPRGGPFLIARRVEDPALPTVLTYAHGDVVNGMAAHWKDGRTPWDLHADGERWYGRGTADNKGQHTVNLGALAQVIAARGGRLGYNVTLLMEMGEEAGSPGLAAFCEAQRAALRADLLVACDGPRMRAEAPTLFLGSRGAANFTLRLRSRDKPYHSGNWGGVLTNPAVVLAHAVASMVDRHGRIQVEGLRPAPLDARLRSVLQGLHMGGGPDDPVMDPAWGEPGLGPAEQLVGWNTLEVLAWGAGSAERPVNAIPPAAVVHCQLRFVVGTPADAIEQRLRAHLDAHGFAEVTLEMGMLCAATRLPLDNPWVDWTLNSMAQSCGRPATLMPNLAGSLPNDVFADLLGLPTLWIPHSYPACAQHAPDEHLLVPVVREGLALMAGLYWDLGEPHAPWHRAAAV